MGSETIGQAFDPASFEHVPVLLNECLDGLAIDPAGIYLDGTAGGAGHSRQIALRLDADQGGRAKAKLITRRPIEANTQELEENRRSRSAHLRVLEKI